MIDKNKYTKQKDERLDIPVFQIDILKKIKYKHWEKCVDIVKQN